MAACWLISIGQPVVDTATPSGTDSWSGGMVLAIGWMGIFMGQFGWVANLVLPIVLVLTPLAHTSSIARKLSVGFALLLLLLTLNAAAWSEIPTDFAPNRIVRFRTGYWLWMGAMLGAVALALISAFLARHKVALSGPS